MITTAMMIDILNLDSGMMGFWQDCLDTIADTQYAINHTHKHNTQLILEGHTKVVEELANLMESHYVTGLQNTYRHSATTNPELWDRIAWHVYVEVDWLAVAAKVSQADRVVVSQAT